MDQRRQIQCPTCSYWEPYQARLSGEAMTAYRCRQGVPRAGERVDCTAYQREPGTDDA